METNLRRPTWVSVLQPHREWAAKASRKVEAPHARLIVQIDADEVDSDNGMQTDLEESSPARAIKPLGASPGECQREFDEARKANPDALYEDLCVVAAGRLGVPARVVKKHVPSPFR